MSNICFELGTQTLTRLGEVFSPVDEVQGFRYFDARDLPGTGSLFFVPYATFLDNVTAG